jgi:hypothetical protein
MDNLSTANSTDISNMIGALELDDHLESHSDGVLEAAEATMAFGPSIACGPTVSGEGMTCRPGPR